jgi:uncharacterized protein YndB with AHSA1/START domain
MATVAITPDQDVVNVEVFIEAPPERVFQAISDPRQVPQWWGQKNMYRVTSYKADLRPGGKWRSDGAGADGQTFSVEGEYLEVDPPRLLVFTWNSSYDPGLRTMVRWELEPKGVHRLSGNSPVKVGGGTLVKIRHSGFAGNSASAQSHGSGWVRVLGWMEAFVSRNETIDSRPAAEAPMP